MPNYRKKQKTCNLNQYVFNKLKGCLQKYFIQNFGHLLFLEQRKLRGIEKQRLVIM